MEEFGGYEGQGGEEEQEAFNHKGAVDEGRIGLYEFIPHGDDADDQSGAGYGHDVGRGPVVTLENKCDQDKWERQVLKFVNEHFFRRNVLDGHFFKSFDVVAYC